MPPKSYGHPRFSPTGNKVSFWIEQIRCEIVVYDLERATLTKITADGDNHFPTWAPDGERIMYLSHKTDDVPGGFGLFSQLANGGGGELPLGTTRRTLGPLTSLSESPAGILALADRGDIWLLAHPGDGNPTPFAPSGFNETMPAFSPDGRRIAYVSDESGQLDVYVRPFPGRVRSTASRLTAERSRCGRVAAENFFSAAVTNDGGGRRDDSYVWCEPSEGCSQRLLPEAGPATATMCRQMARASSS